MKGIRSSALSALVPLGVLTAGCASAPGLRPMPEVKVTNAAARAAPDPDDDEMRVMERDEDYGTMRVPGQDGEVDPWSASGLYVGVILSTSLPMGDFDGDHQLDNATVPPTETIFLPDLDVGAGVGGYLGFRWVYYELLLQYQYSEYDGDIPTGSVDVEAYNLDLNFRRYFWVGSAIQPYGILGIGWSRMDIENAAQSLPPGTTQTAELEDGINVNVGAGLAFYPIPWVCLYGQGVYRFVRFGSADGITGSGSIDGDVDGDGWEVSFGGALRLLPPRD